MKSLTTKEQEILELVSTGLTTKEIAHKLHVSHHTVESHRKNLLRKCQAKNTAELIYKNSLLKVNPSIILQDSLYNVPLV